MKHLSVIAIALAAGAMAASSTEAVADSPNAWLVAAIGASSAACYTGTVEVVHFGGRAPEVTVFRVEHRPGGYVRRVYVAPQAVAGDTLVLRDDMIFSIDAKHRRIVERQGGGDDSPALDDALLHRNYRMEQTGTETFAGRSVVDLTLVNRYSGRATMQTRIDTLTKLVLERKEFAPDGSLLSEMRFEDIRYPASIAASDFALPASYEVVRSASPSESFDRADRVVARAGFAAWEPAQLPGGFSPVKAGILQQGGVRSVQILYSDGLRAVSLFESAGGGALETARFSPQWIRVSGRNAQYAEDGSMAILSWSDGNLHYTLVGEARAVDLPAIASSFTR